MVVVARMEQLQRLDPALPAKAISVVQPILFVVPQVVVVAQVEQVEPPLEVMAVLLVAVFPTASPVRQRFMQLVALARAIQRKDLPGLQAEPRLAQAQHLVAQQLEPALVVQAVAVRLQRGLCLAMAEAAL